MVSSYLLGEKRLFIRYHLCVSSPLYPLPDVFVSIIMYQYYNVHVYGLPNPPPPLALGLEGFDCIVFIFLYTKVCMCSGLIPFFAGTGGDG